MMLFYSLMNTYIFQVRIKIFGVLIKWSRKFTKQKKQKRINYNNNKMKNRNSKIKGQRKPGQSSQMIDEDDQDYQFSRPLDYPFQEGNLLSSKVDFQNKVVQDYMLKKTKKKMETIRYQERNILELLLLTLIYEMVKSKESIDISIIEDKLIQHHRNNIQGLKKIIDQQKEANYDNRIYDPFVLESIFQHLMPINCYQLRDKLSRFTSMLNNITVFVLGMFGSGKTSNIRGQLYYEMGFNRIKGIPSLPLKGKLQKQHESLKTNQSGLPETQDLGTYELKMPGAKKQKYYLIDTPGNYTEINNKLLIFNAQQHCQRSLFVIIHQLQLLKTLQGFFDLAKNIADFFTFSTLEQINSFLILILNSKGQKINQKDVLASLEGYQINDSKRSHKQQVAAKFIFQTIQNEKNYFKPEISFFTSINQRIANLDLSKKKKIEISQSNKQQIKYCGQQFQNSIFYYVDKTQVEKVIFYLDQLIVLNTMFPEILQSNKNRVVMKLKTVSKNSFDKFFKLLNQKIQERMITPKQLDKLEDNRQILQKFNELVAFDKDIYCQKDLKHKMGNLQGTLIDLVNGLCKDNQIHNIVNLINGINTNFGSYFLNLMNSIEEKCRKSIEYYLTCVIQSKKTQKSGQFDNFLYQYKINYDFYCEFSKIKNSAFLQLSKFKDYKQILRQNKNEYIKLMENFQVKLNKLAQCCKNDTQIDESLVNFLNNANNTLIFAQQCKQIDDNKIQELFGKIYREFQPISQSLITKVVAILNFKQNFEQQIASLTTVKQNLQIICKKICIQSISAFPNRSYDKICRVIEENRTKLRKRLQSIIQQTDKKELLSQQKMKEYQTLDKLKKKIKIYDMFANEENKLSSLYERLKSVVDNKVQKIKNVQISDKMEGKSIQLIYANHESMNLYNRFGYQISDKVQSMNIKFQLKLKQFYKTFRVNSIQIKQIRNSTQFNKFKRFKDKIIYYLEYFLPNDIKNEKIIRCYDEHRNIYISVRQIITKLTTLIQNARKENIRQRQYIQKSQEINQNITFDENERVKILKQVYEQLNDIHERHTLFVYSKNQQPKLFNIEGGSFNVIKKEIVKIIQQKVNQIKQSVQSMSIAGDNGLISLSDILKKQCRLWLTFWQVNHSHLLNQKSVLERSLTEIDQKVASFSTNLSTGINDLFDKEDGIKNKIMLERYYRDLKYSLENNVGNYQIQFNTLRTCLDSYLRKQINQLGKLKDSSIQQLHSNLLSKIRDTIQLYQYLTSFITHQDIDKYKIRFLNPLQNSFNRAAQQVKRSKQKGSLYKIQSQIQKHQFKNVKRDINNQQIDNQFLIGSIYDISDDIQKLKARLAQQQDKIRKTYERPLDQDNIDMLSHIYRQSSPSDKKTMRKTILEAYKKIYRNYRDLPYVDASQALSLLKLVYHKIPSEIKQCQKEYQQLFTKAEQRNNDLKKEQLEIIASSSIALLIKKYYDYFSSENSLQDQCCQQLQKKINPIVDQILTKNNPYQIIIYTKSDLISLLQEHKIDEESNLYKLFEKAQDKILIKLSDMQQKSVKKIKIVLEREITTFSFKFEDIKTQTKDISDIHQKLIRVIPSGKSIVDKITQFLEKIKEQFEKLCPINSLYQLKQESNYNINKFGDLLKICIENAFIYKSLFTQHGEKNDKEASEKMIDEKDDVNQIIKKVNDFQDNINRQTDDMIRKLTNFTFDQLSLANSTNLQVRNVLVDNDRTIKLLHKYEDSCIQMKNIEDFKREINTNDLITSLQQKFDKFRDDFHQKIETAIKNKTQQFPNNYNFFQTLLEQINKGYGQFLISDQKDSIITEHLKNPIKFLQDRIQNHINEFKKIIIIQRQTLINFIEIEKPKHQKDKEEIHKNHIKTLQGIQLKKIKAEQAEVRKFNDGELSQDSIKQIEDNSLNNVKNADEQYQKNLSVCIQKFNPSRQDQFIKNYVQSLQNLQKIKQALTSQYESILQLCKDTIKTQLQLMKKKRMIELICKGLDRYGFGGYDMSMKDQHRMFKSTFIIDFIEKTKLQDVKYAINGLKLLSGKQISQETRKLYKQQCEGVETKIKKLKQMAKGKGLVSKKQMMQEIVKQYWEPTDRLQKLAIILCVWSVYNSSNNQDEDQIQYEVNAHSVQILVLIVLSQKILESSNPMKEIQSKLAEVGTGEGKSIVLGTLACYFANQGYQVDVACYSKYLSSRDYKQFTFLFEIFGVKEKIMYGTFNTICQKILNVQEFKKLTQEWLVNESKSMLGNIVSKSMRWFQGFTQKLTKLFSKTKRIFLCDQCDVFFQKQYFGEVFRPILRFCYPQCTKFIEYVWEKVTHNPHIAAQQIISSIEFKALITEFPILTTVFKNQIQQMLQAARKPNNPKHKFIIQKNTIRYMDNGSISDKLHYKFETIFLYLKLRDQKTLSQVSQQNIFIPITIAQFMYSYIPLYYTAIIGLSGTVQQLNKGGKLQILQIFYNILADFIYLSPTIYKQKNRIESPPYLQNTSTYYQKIIELTKIQVVKGRPVLICVQNYPMLRKLQNDQFFTQFIKKNKIVLNFLHQYINDEEQRDKNVKQAVKKGQITLISQQYLRGTDFVVLDKHVKNNGGVHIILTYIPESQSLFIQCIGRTARMGGDGSVDYAFNVDQLPKQFKLPQNRDSKSIKTAQQQYWEHMDRKMIQNKKAKIERNTVPHNRTMKIVKGQDHDLTNFIKFIQDLNYSPVSQKKSVVIALDATSSMEGVFVSLRKHLQLVMSRIDEMKQNNDINGKLQIMVAAYRNYNSGAQILEVSKFYETGEPLVKFLKKINVDKGWGNEGIEILFQHINDKLTKVDIVILIADAPPNTPQHIKRKRNPNPNGDDRINNTWPEFVRRNPTAYPQTTFETELNKFSKQCIISGLYLKNPDEALIQPTETFFKKINTQFKGQIKELNLSDLKQGKFLTQFLTANILTAVTGVQNRGYLYDLYEKSYT